MPSPVPEPTLIRSAMGRWSVTVPWDRADDLRAKLARKGVRVTACLDPDHRSAALEPWPGVDTARVFAEVQGLLTAGRPATTDRYRVDAGHPAPNGRTGKPAARYGQLAIRASA